MAEMEQMGEMEETGERGEMDFFGVEAHLTNLVIVNVWFSKFCPQFVFPVHQSSDQPPD